MCGVTVKSTYLICKIYILMQVHYISLNHFCLTFLGFTRVLEDKEIIIIMRRYIYSTVAQLIPKERACLWHRCLCRHYTVLSRWLHLALWGYWRSFDIGRFGYLLPFMYTWSYVCVFFLSCIPLDLNCCLWYRGTWFLVLYKSLNFEISFQFSSICSSFDLRCSCAHLLS